MDPAEIVGVGGPVGAGALALGYLLRYLIQRKGAERQSESGIVETTNATLRIVRDNQDVMARELRNLRDENTDLRSRLRLKDEQIDKIYDQNRELTQIVDELREEIQNLQAETGHPARGPKRRPVTDEATTTDGSDDSTHGA